MTYTRGYTIVELLIIIIVISILSTIGLFSYNKTQQQSRDSQREISATIVSEKLEEYYAQNGEYPAVSKMTAADANTPKSLLGLNNLDSFIAPRSPNGTTTNLWKTGNASSANRLTYSPNTDTSAPCVTGTAASDVCDDYKIQYYMEKDASVKTILSRNLAIAPPVVPPPTAPNATTVTVVLSGSNAVASTTVAVCTGSASPQYAFRSRTNDGAWSTYTTWGTATTASTPASQGVKYGFQAKAQCIDGSITSAESPVSNEGTYTRPITTPAAPTVVESTSGAITTWNWNTTVCPAGTTARYQYKSLGDWGYDSAWFGPFTGVTSRTWDTTSQGFQYTTEVQTHCYTAFATSNWSGSGQDSYIRPVSAPTGITYGISRQSPEIVYLTAGATCHSSVFMYSRADPHTWDYHWLDTMQYGWYAASHGNAWRINTFGYNGNPVTTGANNAGSGPLSSGSRWNIAAELICRNSTTGRSSASTGRVESPILYLP